MRTTTTKREAWETLPLDHTRWSSEVWYKTKTPRALAKGGTSWQHLTLGDVRSKSPWITHKWWHTLARILWALTRRIMELLEDIWDKCEVPQMNKKSEYTQGNLDDVSHERRNCEKTIQATNHWRLFAFNSERPITMKSSKAKVQINLSRQFWSWYIPLVYLWFISNSEIDSILCLVLMIIMIGYNFMRVIKRLFCA
jgi:hypothetical protein